MNLKKALSSVLAVTMAAGIATTSTSVALASDPAPRPSYSYQMDAASANFVAFKLNNDSKKMAVANAFKLKYTITDGEANSVTFETSNANVAVVSDDGTVKAVGLGTATIKVIINGEYVQECNIVVNQAYYVVLKDDNRKCPQINGVSYRDWKSENKGCVKTKDGKFYGMKSKSQTNIVKVVDGEKYTVKAYCISKTDIQSKVVKKNNGKKAMFKVTKVQYVGAQGIKATIGKRQGSKYKTFSATKFQYTQKGFQMCK